jgi:outer membrane biosynthesis protein TonB
MSQSPSLTKNTKRAFAQRPPRPTTARGPRAGLALSLLLHAALIGATYFTWSRVVNVSEESHSVPVDLITISKVTNVQAMSPPPPPTPPKVEIPTPQMEPPALPQFQDVEPAPEPPVPQFKVEPEKKVDQPQPKPDESKQKQNNQDFAALLNKLTAQPKTQPNTKVGPRTIQGIGAANAMTADLSDALKSQIYQCWSPPVGAPNPDDLVVDFDLTLNPDGSAAGATSDAMRSGNPYTRAAAEAARRAIFQCQPYKLPPDRYSQWREINPLRFDPRQMMGQ